MARSIFIILLIIKSIQPDIAQTPLLVNVCNRRVQSLDGPWKYIIDPYENGYYNYRYQPYDQMETPGKGAFFLDSKPDGKSDLLEYSFDKAATLRVPGDWNTQSDTLLYYEGTLWYKRSFDYHKQKSSNRVFLYFGAVNYTAEVYLNGTKLGTHTGGFTPFNFDVTGLLREKDNFVVVKVDNRRHKEGVPTLNTDWWNYGGITREVWLVETGETFIQDYTLQLAPGNRQQLTGFVHLNGPAAAHREVRIQIPQLNVNQTITTDNTGAASITLDREKISCWSPENPLLYAVTLSVPGDTLTDQIGFRTIQTSGNQLLLNGIPVFLKGICIHEESPLNGNRAHTPEDARQLLTWAKELGCNYVRLAHYPHNEHMVRIADQLGLLVWEEIPVYWTIDWSNPSTYQLAENQLTEMITRDQNRASVIIWSMANETPATEPRNVFLGKLAARARAMDGTRLISAALEQSSYQGNASVRTISDPFAEVVDVLSFNQYIGWYEGLPEKCRTITWKITQNKPVLVSEFGADAKYGFHADSLTRWSEEYQVYLYQETLAMLNRIEHIRGFSPWILKDFRSPRRPLPGIQDGWNRKGLISEKGEKKKAFFILKAWYNSKP